MTSSKSYLTEELKRYKAIPFRETQFKCLCLHQPCHLALPFNKRKERAPKKCSQLLSHNSNKKCPNLRDAS